MVFWAIRASQAVYCHRRKFGRSSWFSLTDFHCPASGHYGYGDNHYGGGNCSSSNRRDYSWCYCRYCLTGCWDSTTLATSRRLSDSCDRNLECHLCLFICHYPTDIKLCYVDMGNLDYLVDREPTANP
ncbi:MAG: hypothetical protein Q615_SPAC00113G0091 [Streptococcus anginosus DORA_7]|uniref:Uncharacterized protein n=1 Tax=Streptococcus anginosus DORA_7 TaxID=1403946 RepID=W1TVD1_STRAP|nr:MAG: hypothetical protein Q615_SPAC00113G0091 [Streptococcus anginosus DORA_7]